MKVLVTGGAGFIGSNVVDNYLKAGHQVVVVDNLSSGRMENLNPQAKFYLLDIRSPELEQVFAIEKPEAVAHLAAQKSVPHSVEDPILDAEINIIGLLNLLKCSVKYKIAKFVFISTGGALYGDAAEVPTQEDCPPQMVSPYAITKYTSEKYLFFYQWLSGLKYTVLRLANVYGPRQIPEGECGVVPIFMSNLLAGKPSKLFAYSDMPRGTTRDYVFVEDVCGAAVLALTKGEGEAFNIGSGRETATAELYEMLQKEMGTALALVNAGERQGDVRRSVLDCAKAKTGLGWQPQFTLEEGLKKTVEYYRAIDN
jgi:UDP-glucose 4-epimerase